jgi:hypothetical protein
MKLRDAAKLKFDLRLQRRRGWLQPGELEAEIERLPDASHKIKPLEEEEEGEPPASSSDVPAPL